MDNNYTKRNYTDNNYSKDNMKNNLANIKIFNTFL